MPRRGARRRVLCAGIRADATGVSTEANSLGRSMGWQVGWAKSQLNGAFSSKSLFLNKLRDFKWLRETQEFSMRLIGGSRIVSAWRRVHTTKLSQTSVVRCVARFRDRRVAFELQTREIDRAQNRTCWRIRCHDQDQGRSSGCLLLHQQENYNVSIACVS